MIMPIEIIPFKLWRLWFRRVKATRYPSLRTACSQLTLMTWVKLQIVSSKFLSRMTNSDLCFAILTWADICQHNKAGERPFKLPVSQHIFKCICAIRSWRLKRGFQRHSQFHRSKVPMKTAILQTMYLGCIRKWIRSCKQNWVLIEKKKTKVILFVSLLCSTEKTRTSP